MEYRSGRDPTYSGSTAAETTLQCKSEFVVILLKSLEEFVDTPTDRLHNLKVTPYLEGGICTVKN